jgi:DNA-binding HxlR family transcriptional regulator
LRDVAAADGSGARNAAPVLARLSFQLRNTPARGKAFDGARDRYAEADSMRSAVKSGYGQDCPVARTLDIVGERWTFLILRDLLRQGPRKFQDLEASLAGIGPNTLSARLKRLEESEIVERRFYEQHPPRAEYVLTAKGRALGPVLLALKKWGEDHAIGRSRGLGRGSR